MNRVKGLLAGAPNGLESPEQGELPSRSGAQHEALQVLTLAQRTADEHLSSARIDAEKIRADARSVAEQIAREAQGHADKVREDANRMLAEARDAAAATVRDAKANADGVRRNADKILGEAKAQAESIAAEAQANAENLKLQAEQRYDDVVGSLAAKREALQQQIEALEQFDRDYRARLTAFMQGQLRALWVDEPQVSDELDDTGTPVPAQRKTSPAANAEQ
jgi:cell division septum initiation protein DivIVA